ncbi:MAG: adenylate/guanylate cyclase domain-containing protein [Candidatus Eremiobacteraeota bacterium]|nr:adenylate/guanylate cyclase domain-containing protein [Candidatus Eremiobacteraeota bacterium]
MVLSGVASSIGLALYLAPLQNFAYLNRVADYVALNDLLNAAAGKNLYASLHIPTVDLEAPNDRIKLLQLDELSAAGDPKTGLAPFPYPRSVYKKILSNLNRAGAKVVAMDINFFENATDRSQDAAFAAGMKQMPTVLPFAVGTTTAGILGRTDIASNLRASTAKQGFSTVDNPGGLLIGQPLTIDAGTQHYVSLVAATVEQYTGRKITRTDRNHARFGNQAVPLDEDGRLLLLPFSEQSRQDISGRKGSERTTIGFTETASLADAYTWDQATLAQFAKGRIVVIGPTAQGLGDFILTPFGRFPGVYANLRMMDQLLSGKFITPVPKGLDVGLIIALPFLLGFFVTQFNATRGILLCLVGIVLYGFLAVTLYASQLVWLDLTHVCGAMLLATLFVAIYRTITEGSDKKTIRTMFGAHVSPEIVAEMLKGDDPKGALALAGKRVKATIFYSDIRGFTSMAENMTPENIYRQLNEYFEQMCAIIFKHGGYVDKFIGDCVMAVFSAPNPKPDDAKRAVLAAIEQQAKILEMGAAWAKQGRQIFTVGMGCNTGEVIMGNLGSSARLNYTVIGDNVNTAARLYNVAKGGEIIISESTYDEVKDFVEVQELQPVTVKGKVKPLRIFNVLRAKP